MLDKFYPVLPDAGWIARLVPLGVKTVQLRLKNADSAAIDAQIGRSLEICAAHGCQLIVNDYWQAAIRLGANYIHLGQEDLAAADIAAIAGAGLRFGLSSHSHEELITALAANPAYVALGPVYETKLKVMPWKPQGLARLSEWKQRIGARPLVAIGGITLERAADVFAAGAGSIAVVTDIVAHESPERRVEDWLAATSGAG
jgi:thiamine-phosphate pyrophosphorylase